MCLAWCDVSKEVEVVVEVTTSAAIMDTIVYTVPPALLLKDIIVLVILTIIGKRVIFLWIYNLNTAVLIGL